MKEMDCVEVSVEKDKYTREGVHKGMQGWICHPECIQGYWLVNFPRYGERGEIASLATEYSIYSNNDDYEFDWVSGASRVAYAAGMGALSGAVSFGLGRAFSGALEPIGTIISAEATVALGLVDFGAKKLLATASSAMMETASLHQVLRESNRDRSLAC